MILNGQSIKMDVIVMVYTIGGHKTVDEMQ